MTADGSGKTQIHGAGAVGGERLYAYDQEFATNLKARTARSVAWNALAHASAQAVRLVATVILARLLLPEDFGLLGMVLVVIAFAMVFRNMGLGAAVIQRRDLTQEQLSTAFWLNLGLGASLTALLIIASPLVAAFYQRPDVLWVMVALAGNVVIESAGDIPASLFQRQLKFRTLCAIDVCTAAVAGLAGIVLAWLGFGVWSLVARSLLGSGSRAGALWLAVGWRPASWRVNLAAIRPLAAFGLPLLGFAALNFFNRQLDNLLVGKVLGAEALGYYTLAYMVMLLPLSHVSNTVARVAFPTLSSMQEHADRVGGIYVRMLRYIAYATFPLMAGAVVFARDAVALVLGEKWLPAVFPIQVLAASGAVQSLYTTVGAVFYPLGKTKALLRLYLVVTPIIVLSFVAGLPWGVNGVCVAYAGVMCVVSPVVLSVALRLVHRGLGDLVRAVARPAALTAVMVLGLVGARRLLAARGGAGAVGELVISALFATVVYATLMALCARDDVKALLGYARAGLGRELGGVPG